MALKLQSGAKKRPCHRHAKRMARPSTGVRAKRRVPKPTWTRGFFRISETALLRCWSDVLPSEKQNELAARPQPERLREEPGSFCWGCCCHETWLSMSFAYETLPLTAVTDRSFSSETCRLTLGFGSCSSAGLVVAAAPSLSTLTRLVRAIDGGLGFGAQAQSFRDISQGLAGPFEKRTSYFSSELQNWPKKRLLDSKPKA